ncbi:MAG TPA: zf-HC2 domain-containing protein [Bryobacteraceae bacterium]|nr:zf-HC2 domain-containing protein [Bryobacteraceae bacterium]
MKHEEAVETLAAERYILGELDEPERERFEEHFFQCAECADDIRALTALREGTKTVAGERPAPATQPASSPASSWKERWTLWWFRPAVAFAAVGVLTATASFMTWQNIQLERRYAPQHVASITLRPETRGEAPILNPSRIGHFTLLEADLPGAVGDLRWQLRRSGATKAISQDVSPAPQSGASFKLLLPTTTIPPGAYELVVNAAENAQTWTFRFTVSAT